MRIRVERARLQDDSSPGGGHAELAEDIVGSALSRFSHRIEDVALSVDHGPAAGGEKTSCRIGARMRGGVVLRAGHAADSVESAMRRAATRLRRRVRRVLGRTAALRRRSGLAQV